MSVLKRIGATRAPAAVIIIRLMIGAVFLSEGVQKFLFPEADGVGRFSKIGIPSPELMAPLVGGVEIACGALILLGLFVRLATLPLLVTMTVAVISTKITILVGHGIWKFTLPKVGQYGFWGMAHEGRADLSMLLGLLFLLIVGAGPWSVDARWARTGNA